MYSKKAASSPCADLERWFKVDLGGAPTGIARCQHDEQYDSQWTFLTPVNPLVSMLHFHASKSVTSHCRKEAALKRWLEEDTRNPRLRGGGISGRSSFARMLLKMGREDGKLNGSHSDLQPLPGPRPSERATTTWRTSTRRKSASVGQSYSGTLLECMNVMFCQLWPALPESGARVC